MVCVVNGVQIPLNRLLESLLGVIVLAPPVSKKPSSIRSPVFEGLSFGSLASAFVPEPSAVNPLSSCNDPEGAVSLVL